MKKPSFIQKFLLQCAGADIATLMQCTTYEMKKYTIMGSCVLIPSVFAIFSGGYAAYLFTQEWTATVIISVLWSGAVFFIDRAVVASTRPGRFTTGAAGRAILSIIISFTISEPLLIKVLNDAIAQQQFETLKDKVQAVEKAFEAKRDSIQAVGKEQLKEVNIEYSEFIGEVDGTRGSKVPNKGPKALEKETKYKVFLERYDRDQEKRVADIAFLKQNKDEDIINIKQNEATGLLGRLKNLHKAMDKDSYVFWAVWFIRAFFLSLELIPLLIKVGGDRNDDLYFEVAQTNKQNAEDVQRDSAPSKKEIFTQEQLEILEARKNKMSTLLHKGVVIDAFADQAYLLEKTKDAGKLKEKLESEIEKKITNDLYREQLLSRINLLYVNFADAIQSLSENLSRNYKSGDKKE